MNIKLALISLTLLGVSYQTAVCMDEPSKEEAECQKMVDDIVQHYRVEFDNLKTNKEITADKYVAVSLWILPRYHIDKIMDAKTCLKNNLEVASKEKNNSFNTRALQAIMQVCNTAIIEHSERIEKKIAINNS